MTTDPTTPTGDAAALLPCPFCGGAALLTVDRRRVGYEEYERQEVHHFVTCGSCGAKGPERHQEALAMRTRHTAADFRADPALRARVEDEYDAYVVDLLREVKNAWHRRATPPQPDAALRELVAAQKACDEIIERTADVTGDELRAAHERVAKAWEAAYAVAAPPPAGPAVTDVVVLRERGFLDSQADEIMRALERGEAKP